MWLIADSGSTKTQWVLHNPATGVNAIIETIGMNPYFIDEEIAETLIAAEILTALTSVVTHVFFYGAGCLATESKLKMKSILGKLFSEAEIIVETDMLGAAHALAGKEKGIVCILGTGANACVYDGSSIVENGTSLGFILGDEGSGAYIGKKLIRALLNNELPADLKLLFKKQYTLTREEIITKVYRKPFPNRYLAGFTRFVATHKQHAYIKVMIEDAFVLFFKLQIKKFNNHTSLPLYFTGSIAFYFQDELREVAGKLGFTIAGIEKSPIEGLIKYHCS